MYCLNIKNGARMKSFKKDSKNKDKEKEFISSLIYWGWIGDPSMVDEDPSVVQKNVLLTGSWDSIQRVFDDSDPEASTGKLREPIDRHNGKAINFLDLKPDESLAASASEDGSVKLYNHTNHKLEGTLIPNDPELPSVLICKFIKGTNCIVTADVEGYLNFYAIPPSYIKNTLLCRKRELNVKE